MYGMGPGPTSWTLAYKVFHLWKLTLLQISYLIPPEVVPGRMGMLVVLLLVIINIMLKIVEMSPMNSGVCGLTSWTIMCLIMVV